MYSLLVLTAHNAYFISYYNSECRNRDYTKLFQCVKTEHGQTVDHTMTPNFANFIYMTVLLSFTRRDGRGKSRREILCVYYLCPMSLCPIDLLYTLLLYILFLNTQLCITRRFQNIIILYCYIRDYSIQWRIELE